MLNKAKLKIFETFIITDNYYISRSYKELQKIRKRGEKTGKGISQGGNTNDQ